MSLDLLDLYRRSTEWVGEKISGATDLDASTPCSDWSVRDLLNHMLDTQRYFASAGRGQQATPPGPNPPDVLSGEPAHDWAEMRAEMIGIYGEEGVIDKTGPALGIAFADSLIHGWDVAKATGQDATMPDGLADAAYRTIHGKFSDEQRKGMFAPEITVADDATPQEKLLAYTGRNPN